MLCLSNKHQISSKYNCACMVLFELAGTQCMPRNSKSIVCYSWFSSYSRKALIMHPIDINSMPFRKEFQSSLCLTVQFVSRYRTLCISGSGQRMKGVGSKRPSFLQLLFCDNYDIGLVYL